MKRYKDLSAEEKKVYRNEAVKRWRTTPKYQAYRKRPERIYKDYINNSKARKISFTLSYTEFLSYWGLPCHYCGDPIETIGLDRLRGSVGYTTGNVVPCCKTCNIAKHTSTASNYIAHCAKVAARHRALLQPEI